MVYRRREKKKLFLRADLDLVQTEKGEFYVKRALNLMINPKIITL